MPTDWFILPVVTRSLGGPDETGATGEYDEPKYVGEEGSGVEQWSGQPIDIPENPPNEPWAGEVRYVTQVRGEAAALQALREQPDAYSLEAGDFQQGRLVSYFARVLGGDTRQFQELMEGFDVGGGPE